MAERDIITEMDGFALDLLAQAKAQPAEGEAPIGLADRLAAFKEIGRWVAIKNRLEDADGNQGEKLRDLKSRLKSDAAGAADGGGHRRPRRAGDEADPDTGSALAALRARIPGTGNGANDRRFRRIGRNPGGETASSPSGDRGVHADLPGGADTEPDGDAGGGEL